VLVMAGNKQEVDVMDIKSRLSGVVMGASLALCAATPVLADDIEIYTTGALGAATIQPNVMFIVDTSGSMNDTVDSNVPYDYTFPYTGSYATDKIYFSTTSTPPGTSLKYSFDKAANKCDASVQKYDIGVVVNAVGPLEEYGYYSDQIAQFRSNSWNAMLGSNNTATKRAYPVECAADAGIHGDTTASANKYIIDNATGWTSSVTTPSVWAGGANVLYLFDGNYLNYKTGAATVKIAKIEIAKEAVKAIVDTNNNINICLMRFDGASPYEGGPVLYPCEDVKASRNDFNTRLGNLTAGGSTPLSEAYYETLLYFGGKDVDYGKTSNPSNQVGSTENGNPKAYETPITDLCQKNYIVFVSDGAPQLDYLSSTRKTALASTFPSGSCNTDPDPGPTTYTLSEYNKDAYSSSTSTIDNCLDELAGWAFDNDVAERGFPAHVGTQFITTYTVGFDFNTSDFDLAAAEQLLRDTATAGNGKFYPAKDKETLQGAFDKIVAEILAINSTFSSPAVSVNAFNRATNLDDLYFTLFKPAQGPHWDGNLKKFKLKFDASNVPFIADQTGAAAVNPVTGFFTDASQSYWSATADGAETAEGGAASRLTLSRNVYTFTGTYTNASGVMTPSSGASLTNSANALDEDNAAITDAMLGGVAANPDITYPTSGNPPSSTDTVSYQKALLMWARGNDILDNSPQNSEAIEPRRIIGDPLHSEPALVQYGETSPGVPDLVAYVATNDGYLHAFNSLTGDEYFSFVPQELLPNLDKIFQDDGVNGKSYGLDGNVVPWINDVDEDGIIEAGETVYLYVGMRRGGRDMYSLDVSNRNAPSLRWKIEGGTGDFAELGQTWSTPDIAKLKLNGNPTTVLIFGAGYDTLQDSVTVRTADTVGRGIYIVDALTGAMLWRAGPDAGASTQMTDMQYSIPGRIKPLDMDGDGYIDRLYAGDMGGQIWRFDINASDISSDLSSLITGGRIANLAVDSDVTATRRFYYPPDVALIAEEGKPPYLSVVAVSGYRAHPLNTTIHDRAYMIRDNDVYNRPVNADYAAKMVTEAELFDTTDNLIGGDGNATENATATASLYSKEGWFISLEELDGSFIGEKGLAEPLILDGNAIFTTYAPEALGPTSSSCTPNAGTGIVYFVDVTNGTPTYAISGTVGTRAERRRFLARGGIPPSPNVIVTDQGVATLCVGTECEDAKLSNSVQKSYWYEVEQ
jgi:type IV pilus assembly protein PilY1